jgi:ABC-type lipoprotein release transport system permease subunit
MRDGYGSNAPIELEMVDNIERLQGVTRVVPRIIGRTYVRGRVLAVLGIDPASVPGSLVLDRGRLPMAKGEVIIGEGAAAYLNMNLGTQFTINLRQSSTFEVVGLFRSASSIWNVDLLLMGFEDASNLFEMKGKATDLSVYTRPGYERIVDVIVRLSEAEQERGKTVLRVQTRGLIHRYTQRGFNVKVGIFAGFYCLVFALGIPSLGVISGFGLAARKREIGVMKATGWQTEEVLEMVALENLLLSLVSFPIIFTAAAVWLHLFNGALIAGFFIPGREVLIPFSVPSRILPIPFVLGLIMTVILTMAGSIYSSWRSAVVPPSEALRQ